MYSTWETVEAKRELMEVTSSFAVVGSLVRSVSSSCRVNYVFTAFINMYGKSFLYKTIPSQEFLVFSTSNNSFVIRRTNIHNFRYYQHEFICFYSWTFYNSPCIDSKPRVGLVCQKLSRNGLCLKLPDMRSLGDIALNPSLRKSKCEQSHIFYYWQVVPFDVHFHYSDNAFICVA